MSGLSPAVHRAIVCVDVEGFGDRRPEPTQIRLRLAMASTARLATAFARSEMSWEDCYHEDRGDGALILISPDVPKAFLVADFPRKLAAALREHNRAHGRQERIRLRLAVHAGEIHYDAHGVAGAAINMAFRLLEAPPLKRALAESSGVPRDDRLPLVFRGGYKAHSGQHARRLTGGWQSWLRKPGTVRGFADLMLLTFLMSYSGPKL